MVDLANVKSVEGVKQRMRESNLKDSDSSDLATKDVLLIFDNADKVLKSIKITFEWILLDIISHCPRVKIILILKKDVKLTDSKNDGAKSHNEFTARQLGVMKLKPLNDYEAVDLFLSTVFLERHITHEELILNEDRDIYTQLQQESSILNCYGIPRYLELLAHAVAESDSFMSVKVSNVVTIPKS